MTLTKIDRTTNLDVFEYHAPVDGPEGFGCTYFDTLGAVCLVADGAVPVKVIGEEYTGEALCHLHGGERFRPSNQLPLAL